ncbi:hypothetical protein FOZ61_002540, partial [Perkinsus olseni]
ISTGCKDVIIAITNMKFEMPQHSEEDFDKFFANLANQIDTSFQNLVDEGSDYRDVWLFVLQGSLVFSSMSIDHPHPPGTARLAAVDDDAHSPSQHGGRRQDLPKIDIHTHILPREWPSIGGFDLRLVDLPQDDELGRKAGFIKRMEWGDGKLFRKVKPNCIDPDVIMKECDSWGVDVQTVCTVPVLFNYHLDPTSGVQWSRSLNVGIFVHPWDMEWCWQG